jgi:hypothetical protein
MYALYDIEFVSGAAAAAIAGREGYKCVWLYLQDFKRILKALKDNEEQKATCKLAKQDNKEERGNVRRLFAQLFSVNMCAIIDEDIAKFHKKL